METVTSIKENDLSLTKQQRYYDNYGHNSARGLLSIPR